MSGFPAIRPGMKLKPVGKQGLMSRNQANSVLAVCNGILNTKLIDTENDEFHITPNNAVYGIGRGAAATTTATGMHPFKIYPTGTFSGSLVGYNVRVGYVDIRSRFHAIAGILNISTRYSSVQVPDDTDADFGPSDYVPSPLPSAGTFFLDPTPEISGGINYGALYSFWIQIDPDTDNGGFYDGAVSIQSQRYSIGPSPTDPFPGLPDGSDREFIPIGIVQVTPPTSVYLHVDGQSDAGLVWQLIHENQFRFTAGQNGLAGSCFQGDIIFPSPNVSTSSPNKVWYPGDIVRYNSGTPADPNNGTYLAFAVFQMGGSPPATPPGHSFVQIAAFDP